MSTETAPIPAPETELAALVKPDSRSASEILSGKLGLSLTLFHDGVRMKRASLRRALPAATSAEIEEKLRAWLLDRPQDQPGVLATWPRR